MRMSLWLVYWGVFCLLASAKGSYARGPRRTHNVCIVPLCHRLSLLAQSVELQCIGIGEP